MPGDHRRQVRPRRGWHFRLPDNNAATPLLSLNEVMRDGETPVDSSLAQWAGADMLGQVFHFQRLPSIYRERVFQQRPLS